MLDGVNNENTSNRVVLDLDNNKIQLDCRSKICFKPQSDSQESSTESVSSTSSDNDSESETIIKIEREKIDSIWDTFILLVIIKACTKLTGNGGTEFFSI